MSDWQAIETAPENEPVLIALKFTHGANKWGRVRIAKRSAAGGWSASAGSQWRDEDLCGWQPAPAPPELIWR